MKNIIKYTAILFLGLLIFEACEDDIDPGVSSAFPLSGEWIVSEYYSGEWAYGPYIIPIYNTSFSKDSIIVDNIYDSGITVKAKIGADNTFAATSSPDINGNVDAITIENGKLVGNDSIYFDVTIWVGGEVYDSYAEAGVRKKGFE